MCVCDSLSMRVEVDVLLYFALKFNESTDVFPGADLGFSRGGGGGFSKSFPKF